MDNAATTRLYDEAFYEMLPYLKDSYANPGGVYEYADDVKRAVAGARKDIASTLMARPEEIYFTSGGTESDNWALKGVAELAGAGSHIITTSFEHHAVLNTCKWLEKHGCRVSYVKPDASGLISVSDIEKLICPDTILISMMYVNNELGTVQPVSKAGALAHERGIIFHTDAVAAYGHIPIDVKKMNIDLLSASGHKFNGPKGTGLLYVNEKLKLTPFMHGGRQEQGRRGGTENTAGIIGMAAAAKRHYEKMKEDLERRRELDRYFLDKLEENGYSFGGRSGNRRVRINGYDDHHDNCDIIYPEDKGETTETDRSSDRCTERRLPGSLNITIPGIDAEELIVRLGIEGICISAGAACASSQDGASHVLKGIGLDSDAANSTIRISFNEDNTEDEIDILFGTIKNICI